MNISVIVSAAQRRQAAWVATQSEQSTIGRSQKRGKRLGRVGWSEAARCGMIWPKPSRCGRGRSAGDASVSVVVSVRVVGERNAPGGYRCIGQGPRAVDRSQAPLGKVADRAL